MKVILVTYGVIPPVAVISRCKPFLYSDRALTAGNERLSADVFSAFHFRITNIVNVCNAKRLYLLNPANPIKFKRYVLPVDPGQQNTHLFTNGQLSFLVLGPELLMLLVELIKIIIK